MLGPDAIEHLEQACYEQHYEFNSRLDDLIQTGSDEGISELLADYPVNTKIVSEGIRKAMSLKNFKAVIQLCSSIKDVILLEFLMAEFSNLKYENVYWLAKMHFSPIDYVFYLSLVYNLKGLAICCLQNGADPDLNSGMALGTAMNTLDLNYLTILRSYGCRHMYEEFPARFLSAVSRGSLPLVQYFHELGCNKEAHDEALRIAEYDENTDVINYLRLNAHD